MAGRIYGTKSSTPSATKTAATTVAPRTGAGRLNFAPEVVDPAIAKAKHAQDVQHQVEQGKQIDAAIEKAAHPSLLQSTKNFLSAINPFSKEGRSNYVGAAKTAVQDIKTNPVGAAEAIPKGLLDVGSVVANTGFGLLEKAGARPQPRLPVFSEEYDKLVHPNKVETDTEMALRTAATNVAGYELGGALTKAAGATGITSRVLGNVVGGQATAGPDMSLSDRTKQAGFDAAFGLATEAASGVFRGVKSLREGPKPEAPTEVKPPAQLSEGEQIVYKTKKLGTDSTGQKILGRTEYDTKTGRAIIYLDPALEKNPKLKAQTVNHEIGHVMDKRLNSGSNLSSEIPNYAGNKANLDTVLADFAAKQNKSVETVVKEVNRDIKKIAKGSNSNEQFANAVAEYRADPKGTKKKAPTFVKLLETKPEASGIVDHQVTIKEVAKASKPKAPGRIKQEKVKPIKPAGKELVPVAKEVPSKFSSTGLKTGKVVKTKGFNPKTINAPEETQALFEQLGTKVSNANRVSKGNEAIRDLARITGLTEDELIKAKPGSIANAETVTAARQLVLDKAQDLMNYLKEVDVSVASSEQLQGIKDRFIKLVAMQKSVAGLRTEASNVFRSLGLELMPGEHATLAELGGLLKQAGLASGDDAALFAGKAAKEFKLSSLQKAGQGALSTWYSAILSGPRTTARNIISTSANILTELVAKTANPKTWKEVPAAVSGLLRGLKEGVGEAKEVLKGAPSVGKFTETGGAVRPSPFDTSFKNPALNKAVRTYGTIVESVGRFLNAQDTLLKAGAREMEAASHAAQGIPEGTLSQAMAKAYSESTVYHGVPKGRLVGALRDAAQTLRTKFPESKIIIPFVDTVANVLDRQFDYLPITSQLRLKDSTLLKQAERIAKDYGISGEANINAIKNRLRDQQIGRMVLGTAVSTAAITLAASGKVSGVGPTSVNERSQLQETGWRPNSIKIGNTWVPYANLGPLAGIFSMAGNVYDKTHYDKAPNKTVESLIGKGIVGWTQTQLDSSFLSGASDLLDALSGGMSPEKYLQNLGAGLIPIPAAYSQTKDMITRQQYETRSIVDKIKVKLGITSGLEPRLDAFGRNQPADLIYGLTPSKETNDPVVKFLVDSNAVVGRPSPFTPYTIPGTQNKRILSPKEYTEYLQRSGEMIYSQLQSMINSLSGAPEDVRQKEINKLTDAIRTQVRSEILTRRQ